MTVIRFSRHGSSDPAQNEIRLGPRPLTRWTGPMHGPLRPAGCGCCGGCPAWVPPPAPPSPSRPDEAWRQIDTEHFTSSPTRSGWPMTARRSTPPAAAERAFGLLEERFVDAPAAAAMQLLDHGPRRHLQRLRHPRAPTTRSPSSRGRPWTAGSLSYFDDWLELVITHELVHTFHLDMTGARSGR